MSVTIPVVAIAFGSVTPPQGDIIELRIHLGCTKEVSSFDCLLQNWDEEYSPGGTNPINVGDSATISIGRGSNCPLILTGRVEEIEPESTPVENYIRVRGRCSGEKIFRRVVIERYSNKKGEEIIRDLIDNYTDLSHVRENSALTQDAASGQKDCVVADGSKFNAGMLVKIEDDNAWEYNEVASVVEEPTFGYKEIGASTHAWQGGDDLIGCVFTCPYNCIAESITVYIRTQTASSAYVKCAIYKNSDLSFVAGTEQKVINQTAQWRTFNFNDPKPQLEAGVEYLLCVWCDEATYTYYDAGTTGQTARDIEAYNSFPSTYTKDATWDQKQSIYCTCSGADVVTMVNNLQNTYTVAANGKVWIDLIEKTDTTYTTLEYDETKLFDVLKYIAESADKSGVIGFDFRVEWDGKFAFFPKDSKTSPISLSEMIEHSRYSKDIHRIRNKIKVYGAQLKNYPQDKDQYTEQNDSETPGADGWSGGTLPESWSTDAQVGNESVQIQSSGESDVDIQNSLPDVASLDCRAWKKNAYSFLYFLINLVSTPNPDGETSIYIQLYAPDVNNRFSYNLTSPVHQRITAEDRWFDFKIPLGPDADGWGTLIGNPNWSNIQRIRFYVFGINTGSWTIRIDGMYFGGRRFDDIEEDSESQSTYGLRELVEVDEELFSEAECELRAKALLDHLSQPAEFITLRTTILDYGNDRLLPGDKIHVTLPNENIDDDYRIISVEYRVSARDQTLEIALELGKEKPLLADYLYGLRSTTITVEKLMRTKAGVR